MVEDLQAQHAAFQRQILWQGSLTSNPMDVESSKLIDAVVNYLRLRLTSLVSAGEDFFFLCSLPSLKIGVP